MQTEDKNKSVADIPQGKEEENKSPETEQNAPGIPFKKGYDPRRRNYGTPHFGPLFRAALKNFVITKDGKQITWEEAIITKALSKAANGDSKMLGIILDRVEGKPKQPIDLDPDGAGTVPISEAEQKRIEALFGFKREVVDLSKPDKKVIVHPIAKAPVPKPIGDVKPLIAPGKLVIANPAKPAAKQISEQTIIFKPNVKR